MERQTLDPVTFDIIKNGLVAAVHESSTLIEKVAYHPILNMGRDRSSGLLTPTGELVCHGHSDCSPHYGCMEEGVKELLKDIPASKMKPGEAYLFNDALRTGTHVNEMRLHRPIFYKGELVFIGLMICHWADVGGPNPGTFNPRAFDCYAEGIRMPPTKVMENDKIIDPIMDIIFLNIRMSTERRCDFIAQIQAAKIIETRVIEMCEKYGVETLKQAVQQLFDYSEKMLRHEVKQLPDGEWECEDFGDADICAPGEPPIRVHCKLTVKGENITFDYTKSDPQPKGSWGATHYTTVAGTLTGFMCCFPHLFPINHGIRRAVNVVTKLGTCMAVKPPAGTTGYCSGAYDKAENLTLMCMANPVAAVKPHRVYAGWVNLANICLGGVHPESGREWVNYDYCVGGTSARTFKDGTEFSTPIFIAFTNTIPHEMCERWFPLLYTKYEAAPDTCGHGKFRGGLGTIRGMKVRADSVVTCHGDREKFPPYGIAGGTNGGPFRLILNYGSPQEKDLGMFASNVPITTKDDVYFVSAGGGGYGNPLERDPQKVLDDVLDRFITLKTAREVYGVSIKVYDEDTLDYRIDMEETKKLRAELAKKPIPEGLGPHQINPNPILKNLKISREMNEEEAMVDCVLVRPPGW
jgi:N-methylhydantoinase B